MTGKSGMRAFISPFAAAVAQTMRLMTEPEKQGKKEASIIAQLPVSVKRDLSRAARFSDQAAAERAVRRMQRWGARQVRRGTNVPGNLPPRHVIMNTTMAIHQFPELEKML